MAIPTPTAFWNLDEASGNAADATGNGNTLTNNNTVTYGTGLIGNAAQFGISNTNKSLFRSSALFTGSGDMSFALWIKCASEISSSVWGIMNVSTGASGLTYGLSYDFNGGSRRVYAYSYNGTSAIAPYTITFGTSAWHHLVLTRSGSTLTLYVDGVSRNTVAAQSPFSASSSVAIATNEVNTAAYASINADMAGVWNVALSAQNVTDLYNAGVGLQYPFTSPSSGFFLAAAR